MALPDGETIPLDVVADRWTKLSGELVTVERIWGWHNEEVLTIVCRNDRFLYNVGTGDRVKVVPKSMATFRLYDFWITTAERDRFEKEHLSEAFIQKSQPTKTNLIKALMLRYLDETQGHGNFPTCIEFLLKNGVSAEKVKVRGTDDTKYHWLAHDGSHSNNMHKTMQNLFTNHKREWSAKNG